MIIKKKYMKEPETLALRLTLARYSLFMQPLKEAITHEVRETKIDNALLEKAIEILKKIEEREKTKWYIS